MRDFRSVCCRQVRLASVAPQRASTINGMNRSVFIVGKICVIRMIPYPPSFSRIAANTIEPAIGASTWAFGSHRCSPYTGIFAKKAPRQATHSISSVLGLTGCIICIKKVGVFVMLLIKMVAISSGIDVVNVYSMKYVPAVRRSVCCPHRVMIIKVGIRVASNIMYIRVRLEAINVMAINSCSSVRVMSSVRCRCVGSLLIVYWLAIIVNGRSQ